MLSLAFPSALVVLEAVDLLGRFEVVVPHPALLLVGPTEHACLTSKFRRHIDHLHSFFECFAQ